MSEEEERAGWAIRITPGTRADMQIAWEHLAATAGTMAADAWEEGLEQAIAALAQMPHRHPIAPESVLFRPPPVRRFIYRRTRNSAAYFVLFGVFGLEATPLDSPTVRVIAIRHASLAELTEADVQLIERMEQEPEQS